MTRDIFRQRRLRSLMRKTLPLAVRRPVSHLLRPYRVRQYASRLRSMGVEPERLAILATIQKSGTHYMRFIVANYVNLLTGGNHQPLSYQAMLTMLPNTWDYVFVRQEPEYVKPSPGLELINLQDFTNTHAPYEHGFWDRSPVIHLYRNPLDYSVSMFHWLYKSRPWVKKKAATPLETLKVRAARYARQYHSFRTAQDKGARVMRIPYEELTTAPESTFSKALRWLGVEPDEELVALAVRNSSISNVRQIEEAEGLIGGVPGMTGRLTRDGRIGQWSEYYDAAQLREAEHLLARHNIRLDDFILEA